jgi:hypothetical protein
MGTLTSKSISPGAPFSDRISTRGTATQMSVIQMRSISLNQTNWCFGTRADLAAGVPWNPVKRLRRPDIRFDRSTFFAAFALVSGLLVPIQCLGRDPAPVRAPRESVVCGPNSLLLFLTLCNYSVGKRLIDDIPCEADGASLLQLCNVCDSIGFPAEIRHYCPSELTSMPLPAIVQFGRKGRHHFFVIYRVTSDGISALDGTTGQFLRFPVSRMEKELTGYALVEKRSFFRRLLATAVGHEGALVALLTATIALTLCIATMPVLRSSAMETRLVRQSDVASHALKLR